MNERETITCIRCRQCRALPETDVRDRHTVIFCEKMQTRRPINLHGCWVADPVMLKNCPNDPKLHREGDKLRYASELEKDFLRTYYPTGDLKFVLAATGRSLQAVHSLAAVNGIRRTKRHPRDSRAARAAKGINFSQAQLDFLHECRKRDLWPRKAQKHAGQRETRDVHRKAILDGIAARGAPFGWKAIVNASYRYSDGFRLKQQKRRAETRKDSK